MVIPLLRTNSLLNCTSFMILLKYSYVNSKTETSRDFFLIDHFDVKHKKCLHRTINLLVCNSAASFNLNINTVKHMPTYSQHSDH